jgi:hypothetical protein
MVAMMVVMVMIMVVMIVVWLAVIVMMVVVVMIASFTGNNDWLNTWINALAKNWLNVTWWRLSKSVVVRVVAHDFCLRRLQTQVGRNVSPMLLLALQKG